MLADLTAVIPVWGNYWKHLDQLLPALSAEGLEPQQIIIIGNGEPVPTELKSKGYKYLELEQKTDIGSARNQALTQINTPYLLYCDADDLPVSGALNHLLAALRSNPRAVISTGLNQRSNGELYPWPQTSMAKQHKRLLLLLRQWAWNHFFITTGTIIRTSSLRQLGGFPAMDLAEDGALVCGLLTLGPIVFLPRATRVYRIHPSGLCQRGHSAKRWRRAYTQQRQWLRANPAIPRPLRALTYLYPLLHYRQSRVLARRARFDY